MIKVISAEQESPNCNPNINLLEKRHDQDESADITYIDERPPEGAGFNSIDVNVRGYALRKSKAPKGVNVANGNGRLVHHHSNK